MEEHDSSADQASEESTDSAADPVDAWVGDEASSPTSALREVRRAFVTLLENIPGMAYRCANDPNWTMHFVSGKAETLTGYGPEELKGNAEVAYGELIHPGDRDGVWAKVQDALERDEAFQLMYRIRDREGQTKWVYEQGCGVFDDGQLEALEGFITDITEQRRIEERSFRAQRMSTIARLLEQIGGDFQDQISIISTYAGMIAEEVGDREPIREDVDRLVEAAERARTMTGQLLKFARPEPGEPEPIEINVFLDHHTEALESIVDGIGRVEMDPAHLSELLVHLVVNAREAMGDEPGRIAIRSGAVEVDEGVAFEHAGLEPGEYVTLTVEDNGGGMDEETRQRVFEPYFSTKDDMDEHRGLGLPTVYGLIRRAGGHVRIASEPGEGTEVTVYLPKVDE
ncbi:MAG: nitrogen regulation protein NR(II) [Bradymonadaceae bacterium]